MARAGLNTLQPRTAPAGPRERRVTHENVPLADDLDGYPAISRAGRQRDSPRLLPRRPRTGAPSPTPTTGTPPRPRPQDRHEQAHRRRDEDPHKHRPGGRPRRHCADLARKPARTRPRPRRQGRRTRDPKHTTDLGPARTRPTRTEPKHAQPDSHIEPFSSDHWRCPRAIAAAVRDGRGRAHPGRDVHFALENDGWSCTFEYEVHVWASGGARPGPPQEPHQHHHAPAHPSCRADSDLRTRTHGPPFPARKAQCELSSTKSISARTM